MEAHPFIDKLRAREPAIGYWMSLDVPLAAERLGQLEYDYVCLDMQHGLFDYHGITHSLMAIDAGRAAPIVRVPGKDPRDIGQALDLGARAVILPLVESADEAAELAGAARFHPAGRRSFGPLRASLRVGPQPHQMDEQIAVIAMIETMAGLDAVDQIASTPGIDAVYVGPADLTISLGGGHPGDPAVQSDFDDALERVRRAAESASISSGMHTLTGEDAARRLGEGFTFVSVAGDLGHLVRAAAAHLTVAAEGLER